VRGDRLLELDEGEEQAFQRVFEVWIAAIAAVLMAEGMEANVAKQQAEKAVILALSDQNMKDELQNSEKLAIKAFPTLC
jgi:hypothetical protein